MFRTMKAGLDSARLSWILLAASLIACIGIWRWAEFILVPANTLSAQSKGIPIGNNSDLYPRWFGARQLLLRHQDPYGREVTRGIERGFYGRELDPNNPNDPIDPAPFSYPIYVVFLLAPTVTLSFASAQTLFRWLLLLGIAVSVPTWMYTMGFRTRPAIAVSGMLLAVGSYPAVLEFHMQNLAALVALFLALAAAAATRGYFLLSGFLLALATIKPQLSALFVVCLLLWATGRWQQRRRLVLSFAITLGVLVLAGMVILLRWILEFAAAARAYSIHSTDPSILQFVFGAALARGVAVTLCGILVFAIWRLRTSSAGSKDFGWMLASVATVTLAILPVTVYNQVLLIPAFLVLLLQWQSLPGLPARALAKGVFVCQGWQWVAALFLSASSLAVSAERLRFLAYVPVGTLIALPPLTLLAIAASSGSLPLIKSARPTSS